MKMHCFLVVILFQVWIGCHTPAGHHGISQDISDSKKRDVFIAEYEVLPNPFKMNDTLQLTVMEVWLERHWAYGSSENETILYPTAQYQLCINTIKKDIQYMEENWTIGLTGDQYMRGSNDKSLVGDFQKMPGDTIKYDVQKGMNLSDSLGKIVIGKLIIVKKNTN